MQQVSSAQIFYAMMHNFGTIYHILLSNIQASTTRYPFSVLHLHTPSIPHELLYVDSRAPEKHSAVP